MIRRVASHRFFAAQGTAALMSPVPIPVGLPRSQAAVVTVGNFDGVHLGHAAMLARVIELAQRLQLPSLVVTFDPPPLAILAPERLPPRLTTVSQKTILLKSLGISDVIVWPATRELLSLTAEEFFQQIVIDQLQCQGIVEGPNFCFGRGRAGDVALLRTLGEASQIPVVIAQASESSGRMISSSEIRAALHQGNVVLAYELLGRPYTLTGTVVAGAQRGRTIGFPTANLAQIETLIPPHGVYAGRTTVHGRIWPVALNIGPNPTFGEHSTKIEAYLIGYTGDLYGQVLTVELLQYMRGVRKFAGIDQLKAQLQSDIAAAAAIAHG